MAQTVTTFLQSHGIPPELIVFLISMVPILELRGGLIAASILGVPWYVAAPVAILGNAIPVPFIIIFIERILGFLRKHGPIKKFANFLWEKGIKKGAEMEQKYPTRIHLGLLLFVGIPLPGTGAWTGSLIAALMGLKPKRSVPWILLGVLLACVIMLIIAYFIPSFLNIKG